LGLCFPCQLVSALPAEPHDQRMDGVITGEI
jgi:5-formyltetrahydrofolate cyclo-ligase